LIGELSPFTFRMMVERYLLIPVFPFHFIHTEAPVDYSFFKCKVEEFIEIEKSKALRVGVSPSRGYPCY
jgi:hypothetical protein